MGFFRDPIDGSDNPYELLDVEPNTSARAVHSAFLRRLADRPKNLVRLQEAKRKLEDPEKRLAVDLSFYHADGLAEVQNQVEELVVPEPHEEVPSFSPEQLYTDLLGGDFEKDFSEIDFAQMEIVDLVSYDDIEGLELKPDFDR